MLFPLGERIAFLSFCFLSCMNNFIYSTPLTILCQWAMLYLWFGVVVKWCSQPGGHCWNLSHGSPSRIRPGASRNETAAHSVSGGHISLLCLSYYSCAPPRPPSIPLSLTHLPFMHTHRNKSPLCGKMDGMFPNHRCCSTCGPSSRHNPDLHALFLLLSPVVFAAALQLWDNEELGWLQIRYTINLAVYETKA